MNLIDVIKLFQTVAKHPGINDDYFTFCWQRLSQFCNCAPDKEHLLITHLQIKQRLLVFTSSHCALSSRMGQISADKGT